MQNSGSQLNNKIGMQYSFYQQPYVVFTATQPPYQCFYPSAYQYCYILPNEAQPLVTAPQKQDLIEENNVTKEEKAIYKQDCLCKQESENLKQTYDYETQESSDEFVIQSKSKKRVKQVQELDPTNLHKNISKAIVAYAASQQFIIYKLLGEEKGQEFFELMQYLKNKISNISHLVKYTKNPDYLQAFRIIGFQFLKKQYPAYIYNSKIVKKSSYLRNKAIIKKALLRL